MGRLSRLLISVLLALALPLLVAQTPDHPAATIANSGTQSSVPIPDYSSQLPSSSAAPSRLPGQQVSSSAPDRTQQLPAQPPSPIVNAEPVLRVPPPPENATAAELEGQGDDLRAQKAFLDAMDYYRAALKKQESAVLHNKIGMCLLQLRRDSESRKEFQRAIHLDKDYPEAYNNLGALYYNTRKFGPAIKEYRKAIKLNDLNAAFHTNLGYAYFAEKDYDHASREYQRAIQIDPEIFQRQSSGAGVSVRLVSSNDLGHFHYVMAQMYGQQGDLEHCRYYLSKANEEGYPIRYALHDNEFAVLRKDPNFVNFVRSLKPPPPADSNNN
jgi:tetratricopeptide (TPR) repeat protein